MQWFAYWMECRVITAVQGDGGSELGCFSCHLMSCGHRQLLTIPVPVLWKSQHWPAQHSHKEVQAMPRECFTQQLLFPSLVPKYHLFKKKKSGSLYLCPFGDLNFVCTLLLNLNGCPWNASIWQPFLLQESQTNHLAPISLAESVMCITLCCLNSTGNW